MQITALIPVFVLALSRLAASQDVGRSCGFKMAPCPSDMYCQPNSDDCPNVRRCPGYCTFRNTYPSCGGFRPSPVPMCDEGSVCKDDPRNPTSCGMACDAPGICIPNKQPRCNPLSLRGCPKGLFCYRQPTSGVGWPGPHLDPLEIKDRDLREEEENENNENEKGIPFRMGICL